MTFVCYLNTTLLKIKDNLNIMFHYKDGLFFKREEDGSVTIIKRETAHDDAKIIAEFNIDADGWCSIIATVSDTGETSAKWDEANKFHGNN